jgi:hypothetical protein
MLVQHTLDRLRQLGLLVDQEWTLRQNRRLTRLLQEAKLRFSTACL